MSVHKSFLKNNLVLLLGHLVLYAKGIILLPLLIKNVGINTYGTFILVTSFIGIVFGISSFGVGFQYQRFMPSAVGVEEKRNLFFPQFYFQGISVAILTVLVFYFGNTVNTLFIKTSTYYSWFLVGSILPATFLYSQATDYFRYTHRMGHFSLATAANPYLFILLTVLGVFLLPKIGMNYLLLAMSASIFAVAVPMLWKMLREIGIEKPRLRLSEITSDMRLGLPILFSYIIDFVMAGSDRFVIDYYMSAKEVGYYNPAYTLGALVIMFPKIMGIALPPLLSKAVDEHEEGSAEKLLNKAIKFYLMLAIPFIAGCFVLGHYLLMLLANKEVADASYGITPIIAVGILFFGLNIILSFGVAFVKMKTKLIFYSNVIAGLLGISLNLIFMHFYRDILIAAVVSLVSFSISFLFLNYNCGKLMKIVYDKVFLLKVSLSSVVMGLCLHHAMRIVEKPSVVFLLLIPTAIILYVAVLFLLRSFDEDEISFLKSYLAPPSPKQT